MESTVKADPARGAWKAILELVGWGSGKPPRIPAVAIELDLSPKQLGVLWKLEPGTEQPMWVVGKQLYCEASYVTDLTDKLEARGLIERRADPADRRVKLLALTDEGVKLRERALELLYEPPEELLALDPDERRTLERLLGKAVAA